MTEAMTTQQQVATEESRLEVAEARAKFEAAEAAYEAFDVFGYQPQGEIRMHPAGPFLHLGKIDVPAKFIESITCPSFGLPVCFFVAGRPEPLGFSSWHVRLSEPHIPQAVIEIRMSSGRAMIWSCDPRVVEMQIDHLQKIWRAAT